MTKYVICASCEDGIVWYAEGDCWVSDTLDAYKYQSKAYAETVAKALNDKVRGMPDRWYYNARVREL
jgi:hypothetical protein